MNKQANQLALIAGALTFQFKGWQRRPTHSKHVFGTNFDDCDVSLFRGCICLGTRRRGSPPWMWFLSHPPGTQRLRDAGTRELSTESQGRGATRNSGYRLDGKSVRRLTEKWPHLISATHAGSSLGWVIITHLPKTEIKPVCCFNFCAGV